MSNPKQIDVIDVPEFFEKKLKAYLEKRPTFLEISFSRDGRVSVRKSSRYHWMAFANNACEAMTRIMKK